MKIKNYNAKIYTLAGVYVKTLSPSVIMGGFSFSAQADGGQGELRLKLALSFSQTDIAITNIIKLYAVDEANPSGRQIYTGIVGSLRRISDGGTEYVELRALGLASMLSWGYYKDTGSYSFSKNQEPATTLKAVVDDFATQYPGLITYDGSSIENFGSSTSTSFAYAKRYDAIKNVADLTTYFWTIDGTGKLQFHPKTGGIGVLTHKVTIGKDIDKLDVEENSEKVVNNYLLDYSGGSTTASDGTSQTAYGVRELHESKTDITNGATATIRANTYIAENKDLKKKISITINSNYDIESIRPGDLLTVANLDYSINSLQIRRIEYTSDNIRLELEEINSFGKEIFTS